MWYEYECDEWHVGRIGVYGVQCNERCMSSCTRNWELGYSQGFIIDLYSFSLITCARFPFYFPKKPFRCS